ncbi:MAG: histidine kinase [Bacteroidota bacterium]
MLKIKNENDFQEVEISGTNNKINTILYNMGKNLGLFSPEYVSFKTSTFSTTIEEYKWADQALDIFRNHLKENSIEVTQRVISFIENEMTAMEFLNYYLVANLNLRDFRQSVIKENEKVKYAKQRIQNFDLHDVYNNYGYFSRRLADSYLAYYLNQLPRIDGNEKSVRQGKTITEEFFRAKLILGGDLFYQTMAGRIEHLVTRQFSVVSNTDFTELENAIVLINQLKNQSYDSHFFEALANFRDNRLKWETDFYVPEVELYQKNGQKIVLKEIIKGKPTILYIHRDWSRHRYYWDELAQKYPRIRFVFVMEGNNLKKWQDYLRQAEPVAEQYLLNAEENSLENVFMRSNQMYIVYGKNGELLDFDVNEEKAIQLAKENLEQKNEPDKSQLITIIVILGSLLFISLLVFILWRWRTRQRLRKEQQQRRLRELELTAIRSQMNPHFLFNCLNSVQNLVQQNKGREAHLYLSDFAGLIRKVLQNSEKEEVSLAEELETVEQYLRLEKLRFDFNFQVTVSEGIDPHNTPVPSMLLQPFAENAVIHGLQNKEGERKLKIEVLKESEQSEHTRLAHQASKVGILIIIEDNGIGRAAAQNMGTNKNGKGSKLMQERLQILQEKQNEKYHLQITDLNENGATGTRVEIWVPEEK